MPKNINDKKYYETHKELILAKRKLFYEKNKERIDRYNKEYYQKQKSKSSPLIFRHNVLVTF